MTFPYPDPLTDPGIEAYAAPPLTIKSAFRSDPPEEVAVSGSSIYLSWPPYIPQLCSESSKPPSFAFIAVKCCSFGLVLSVTRGYKRSNSWEHDCISYKWINGFPVGLPPHFFSWDFGSCVVYPYSVLVQEPLALYNFLSRFETWFLDGLLSDFYYQLEDVVNDVIPPEEFVVCLCPGITGDNEPAFESLSDPLAYIPWDVIVAQAIAEGLEAILAVLDATIPRVIWWTDNLAKPTELHRISIPVDPSSLDDIHVDSYFKLQTSCDTYSAFLMADSSFLICFQVDLPEVTADEVVPIPEPPSGFDSDIFIISYEVLITPDNYDKRTFSLWESVDDGTGDQRITSISAAPGETPNIGGVVTEWLSGLAVSTATLQGKTYSTFTLNGQQTGTYWNVGATVEARLSIVGEFSGYTDYIELPPVGSPQPDLPDENSDPPLDPNQGPNEPDGTLWVVDMKLRVGVDVGPLSLGFSISEVSSEPYCAKTGPAALEWFLSQINANLGVISFSYRIVGQCTL